MVNIGLEVEEGEEEEEELVEEIQNLLDFPSLMKITMKNISPSILPDFHGLRNEDPETFLFEFEVLCRSYDYLLDTQKLKLFPTTLKDATLKWSMGLGAHTIRTGKK